jgi:hypothetical protein
MIQFKCRFKLLIWNKIRNIHLASYTNPRTGNTKGCTDNKLDCFTTNHNDDDLIINAPSHLLSGTKYYITFIWYHTTKPKCCTHYIIT